MNTHLGQGPPEPALIEAIESLSAAAAKLLEVVCCSLDGEWATIKDVAGAVSAEATALERAGLVVLAGRHCTLSDDSVGPFVREGIAGARRRVIEKTFASTTGVSRVDSLRHAAHATLGVDDDLADALAESAHEQLAAGGPENAATLLGLAARLSSDSLVQQSRQLQAGSALVALGSVDRARPYLDALLADDARGLIWAAATARMAELEALNGDPHGAQQRLERAIAVADDDDDTALLHAVMSIPLGMLGMVRQIADHASQSVALATKDTTRWHIAVVVHAHAAASLDDATPLSEFDRVVEQIDVAAALVEDPRFGLHLGRALVLREREDDAVQVLMRMIAPRRGVGALASLAMSCGALGEVQFRSGLWDAADLSLSDAIDNSFATEQRAFATFWLAARGRVRGLQGDVEAGLSDLATGVEIADELSLWGARYFLKSSLGAVLLSAGHVAEAIDALEEVRFFEAVSGALSPTLSRWPLDLVDAYVTVGRVSEARDVCRSLALLTGAGRWTRGASALAEAMCQSATDPAAAKTQVGKAIRTFNPDIDRLELGRSLVLQARLCAELGDTNGAHESLGLARATLGLIGARPLLQQVDLLDTKSSLRVQVGPLAVLSVAELDVLAAVATGMTNRQVAAALNLSSKTVANHLYRIYRRIGVASRTEATVVFLSQTS